MVLLCLQRLLHAAVTVAAEESALTQVFKSSLMVAAAVLGKSASALLHMTLSVLSCEPVEDELV